MSHDELSSQAPSALDSGELDHFIDGVLAGRLSRRQIIQRSVALGLTAPAIASLLAASPLGRSLALAQGGSLSVASNQSDPAPRERIADVFQQFSDATGIDVSIDTVNHEDFKVQIRTLLAADNPPDLLTWFAGNRMRYFTDRGLILPITDLFTGEGGLQQSFSPAVLDQLTGTDGEYYFFPISYYSWGVHYRKSVFEEHGITVPATWDEFLAAIDALAQAGLTPIQIGAIQPWTLAGWFDYLDMRINGPEFHRQLTSGEVAYNTPEVKAVFERFRELKDRNAFNDDVLSLQWQDAAGPIVNGEAGMMLIGNFIQDQFTPETVGDLDFFQFPIITEGVGIGEDAPIDGFFIAAKAQNPDGAKEFFRFFADPQIAGPYAIGANQLSPVSSVPLENYSPLSQKAADMLQNADYIAQFYDRDHIEEFANVGMSAMQEWWLDPDSLDSILEDVEAERQRIYSAEQ